MTKRTDSPVLMGEPHIFDFGINMNQLILIAEAPMFDAETLHFDRMYR